MNIGVQSYPALYTMLLGWDLYGKLWDLLTETGIAYLPFIGLILKNISQSYATQGHLGAGNALRSMEINLIMMSLLIFFAVSPLIPLDAHTISYSPLCEQGDTYHPGSTRTTYDNAFTVPTGNTRVPIGWYAVMSVSEGITNAANNLVGCVPDLRKMVTQVNMAFINDPEVKQELQDFNVMCYAPAKAQFFNDNKKNNSADLNQIQESVKKYGVEDTEWLGSHAFNEVYYRNLKSTRAVPGFSYAEDQDINAETNKINPPAYGMPTCYEWWNDSVFGLKNRLYQTLPKSFVDEFKEYLNGEQAQDDLIKKIISNGSKPYLGYENANDTLSDISYSHLASAVGTWYHQLEEYPKIYAAAQAAPIVQALLLLLVTVFLPFALVFSGYKPIAFVTGALLIFSLIFWSFIWHLVSWTDHALMQALYSSWFSRQGAGATLADMIMGSLIIAAPVFWFLLMGAMGVSIGHIVSGALVGLNKIGDSAGRSGMVQSIGKTAATAAKITT